MDIREGALVTVTVCEFQNNEAYAPESGAGVRERGSPCLVCPRTNSNPVS